MLLSTPSVTASDPSPDGPNVGGPTSGQHIEPVRADADLEQLLQDQGPVLGSRFAGAWLDSDGNAHVGITGGSVPEALAAHPKVRMVERRFSLDRLDATMETVVGRLGPLLTKGWEWDSSWPYSARVNVLENIVDVDVDPRAAHRRRAIEEALADEMEAGTVRVVGYHRPQYQSDASLHEEKLPELPPVPPSPGGLMPAEGGPASCGPRDDCLGNFRGGIEASAPAADCTLGFVMRNSVGVRFHSSAGHCHPKGSWKHAGRTIGGRSQWYHPDEGDGPVDFQTIWHNNQSEPVPSNVIYRSQDSGTKVKLKITTPGPSLLNNYLCVEGQHAGRNEARCGQLTDYNATIGDETGFGRMASVACEGDSGAPVVADTTDRAYGVHMGSVKPEDQSCGSPAFFTWVPRFESRSGRQVLLTTTTEGLGPGQRMNEGYSLRSRDGKSKLVMQNDGNLVVYRSGMGAVWAAGTNGPNRVAIMQNDGNFVVYGPGGALWASGTSGPHRTLRLMMQDDGNLVVYKGWTGLWACC